VPSPAGARGVPRAELYLLVDDPAAACALAEAAGATAVSGIERRPWGDLAAYVRDPDGHVVAFAERGDRP
jgi:uncharacterized glyoxalase superfamily protein PhnB